MLKSSRNTRAAPIEVLVATPFGAGGRGGIDRLMDTVRTEASAGRIPGCRVRIGATRGPGSLLLSPFYLAVFLVRMALLRAAGRLDVVHINLASHGSAHRKAAIGRVASWLGLPYVVHLHGSRFRGFFDAAHPRTQAKVRRLFADAARVLVLGRIWRDYVTERIPEAGAQVTLLPNATAAFGPRERQEPIEGERLRILFLGQLGARKGVADLISALAGIADLDAWETVIAGDGAVDEARRRAASLGIASRIAFPGWTDPAGTRHLLETSDILVLPSYDENLPMSVIEGMSAGLAVLATPVGAVEDILADEQTGLLVAPGDVEALTRQLRRLVTDAPLRQRLGEAAAEFHRQNLELEAYGRRLADIWLNASR